MNRNLVVANPLRLLVVAVVLAAVLMAAAQAQELVSVRSEKLERMAKANGFSLQAGESPH